MEFIIFKELFMSFLHTYMFPACCFLTHCFLCIIECFYMLYTNGYFFILFNSLKFPDLTYVGCYKNFNSFRQMSNVRDIGSCIQHCRGLTYKYVCLQVSKFFQIY